MFILATHLLYSSPLSHQWPTQWRFGPFTPLAVDGHKHTHTHSEQFSQTLSSYSEALLPVTIIQPFNLFSCNHSSTPNLGQWELRHTHHIVLSSNNNSNRWLRFQLTCLCVCVCAMLIVDTCCMRMLLLAKIVTTSASMCVRSLALVPSTGDAAENALRLNEWSVFNLFGQCCLIVSAVSLKLHHISSLCASQPVIQPASHPAIQLASKCVCHLCEYPSISTIAICLCSGWLAKRNETSH